MTEIYAPNQQNVRADGSGPAEEGEGGVIETPTPPQPEPQPEPKPTPQPTGTKK